MCKQKGHFPYPSLGLSSPYCSPIWRPHLIGDIALIKRVQRRATKFIMGWSSMDYKQCLISLHILPHIMNFEPDNIMFFIKSLKSPIASHCKLLQQHAKSNKNRYLNFSMTAKALKCPLSLLFHVN